MRMRLADIGKTLEAVGDSAQVNDLLITGVSTDSRSVSPGDLFVCLPGERFDGHHFAWEAVHRGAAAVLVERPLMDFNGEVPMLLVRNTLQALGRLAAEWRRRFQGVVLGITGTAGKTTVKEFLAAILSVQARVGKNHKNWNNQLGLPLSILEFDGNEQYWVLEAGISETGEMETLASILKPDVALIVNVGPCHLKGLGDLKGVAREKCRLLSAVPRGGWGIIGGDYPEIFSCLPEREDLRLVSFSSSDNRGRYRGSCLRTSFAETVLVLHLQGKRLEVTVPFSGRFMLENVLAAATAADVLGLESTSIEQGLSRAKLPEHRCQIKAVGPFQIIDDCYNANPLAMRCALSSLEEIAGEAELVLVLGEMKELGPHGPGAHKALGEMAARTGCRKLIYFGNYSEEISAGLSQGNYQGRFLPVHNVQTFLSAWRSFNLEQGVLFFKGSRGCGLETFVEALLQEIS